MRFVLRDEAVAEAREARLWYAGRSPRSAARFMASLDRAIASVVEAPRRWRKRRGGVREAPLRGYPFRIVYRLGGDELEILAVSHTSRRPGHWRDR